MNDIKEISILIAAVVALILIIVITLIIIKKKKKQKNQPEQVMVPPITNNEVKIDNNINVPTETPAGINMFDQNINTNINPVNQVNQTPEINNTVEPIVEQNNQIPVNNMETGNQVLPQEQVVAQPTNQVNEPVNNNEQQLFVYNPNNNQSQAQNIQPESVQTVTEQTEKQTDNQNNSVM